MSSGFVSIPCYPLIFDGVNYTDFISHMRIHLRGLRLWAYSLARFLICCALLPLWNLRHSLRLLLIRLSLMLLRLLMMLLAA